MPNILDYLNIISNAVYGKDVRQAIVDAISACYADGKAGVSDLEARRLIESAIAVNEDQQADIDTLYAEIAEIQGGGGESSQESTSITLDTIIFDGGFVDSVSVANNATATYDVTFEKEFTEVPEVFACVAVQNSAGSAYSKVTVGIVKSQTSTTGFRFFIANTSGASRSVTVVWAAFQPTTQEIDLDITIPSGDGMSEADVLAITNPIQTALNGIKTGYDGTVYSTPGEALRTQINNLHVLIGDEPGVPINASAIGYGEDSNVADELTGLNGRLEELEQTGGSGASVPTEVRQALYRLFNNTAFGSDAGFTSDITVLQSWAMEITEITINQSIISISGTGTSQLTAVTVPAGGLVTWSSSNPAVATVSSTGLVTGVSNGTSRIIASCGGKNATCNVIVSGFATLTSITATFTQSGAVYDTDTLDSLKANLVVTANYDNSTSESISDYTLSGTLAEGTSTITASYGGFTDTFNVVVTRIVSEEIINQYTPYDSLNTTTFENVTGSAGSNNIVTDAGTINASKVRFQWDTDECNLFQIQICQYDSSGTPYKMSNLNKYGTAPITSGDAFDTTTGAWSDVGITPKFTAIAGGDITVNLPTSGKFRLQLRKTNQSTGTEVTDNATFKNWVEGDGITITAIL